MRALASLVMRGRTQAATLAASFAVLALLLPPVSVLSSAVVGLVALREGERAGLWVMGLAGLGCGLMGGLAFGNPLPVLGYVALLWLPVWILALVLRSTRSLEAAVQAALVFGVLFIAVYFLQMDDPEAGWKELLQPFADAISQTDILSRDQQDAFMTELARWMTGLVAAGFFLQLVVALFIARWWQAMLYNPGGFRAELHSLRLSRTLAYLTLPLLAAFVMNSGGDWQLVRYLGTLAVAAYALQGLAVVHGVVGKAGAHSAWLYGMYVVLFFAMPQVSMALALTGYLDAWLDFRGRIPARKGRE